MRERATIIDDIREELLMAGQGSTGNVIAAVCSFFIPGLGQLVQGRILAALVHFILGTILWVVTFGMFGWIANIIDRGRALEA